MKIKGIVRITILLALIGSFSVAANAGEIYKCKVNGKLVFTDQPCEGSEQVNLQSLNTSQKVADINRLYNGDRWYEDSGGYEAALSVAESYDAPMIIYFRTDWCSYCVAVDKKLLPKSGAKRAIESFVKIKINPDHGAKERKIFEGMGGTGYPTFLVRSAEGKVSKVSVTPRKGSERRNKGYKSLTVDEFVTKMEKHQPKI